MFGNVEKMLYLCGAVVARWLGLLAGLGAGWWRLSHVWLNAGGARVLPVALLFVFLTKYGQKLLFVIHYSLFVIH